MPPGLIPSTFMKRPYGSHNLCAISKDIGSQRLKGQCLVGPTRIINFLTTPCGQGIFLQSGRRAKPIFPAVRHCCSTGAYEGLVHSLSRIAILKGEYIKPINDAIANATYPGIHLLQNDQGLSGFNVPRSTNGAREKSRVLHGASPDHQTSENTSFRSNLEIYQAFGWRMVDRL